MLITLVPAAFFDCSVDVTRLLEKIHSSTKVYLDFIQTQGLPEPSYEHGDGLNTAINIPRSVLVAKDAAIEATDELHHLLSGPLGLILSSPGDQYLLLALQYIYRYNVAAHVPSNGHITFEELARATNVNVTDLSHFLRVAIGRHVFHEPKKHIITHTAASKLLVNHPMVKDWLMNIAEEFWPSLTRTVDATTKWPGSEEPNQTGYSLAHNTTESPFRVIESTPARHTQFINAMKYSHIHSAYSVSHLIENYDFGAIGPGTIVDVGGSTGQVSIEIAKKYPQVRCIVQDIPDTIARLDGQVPIEIRSRIRGMAHDFLTPQPVQGADIYLFRWILHDWSDKYCVKILRALVPALKEGSRVLVNDICIPDPGVLGTAADRALRTMDISMKAFNNARERDAEAWESLFAKADSRFRFLGITIPPGAQMAIIEAEWSE
ncbi:O-methyltransferase [Aspergillus steynii IBT 23096]|uniref:O-methyltransferase n=1 Tax=Aspergillus steynii IBT 23096 TaxID=1392250 RepID=A0A2I2GPS9_9EURO|nr:O-methyltransferase [Aspergillus steynii IBT 23096]PLB54881.1 O-methyltransferase [Aspergillus steynii IBT 23096]